MANKTIGCVSMCIDFAEAVTYANTVVDEELDDTNYVEKFEIQRMPGGSYRVGVILMGDQLELFGAEEDA